MEPTLFSSPDIASLLTLFARQVREQGFSAVSPASLPEFLEHPGGAVLFFADDPKRVPETWDVAVVLPDILRASGEPLCVGLLDPAGAKTLAERYGVVRWPSLVFLRDGEYLGVIERMRDWDEYAEQIPEILARPASRPPLPGMPPSTNSLTTH